MKILVIFLLLTKLTFAGPICQCELQVSSPVSASHKIEDLIIYSLDIKEFSRYSRLSMLECKKQCLSEYKTYYPSAMIKEKLFIHTEKLIEQKLVGHNCTGETVLFYPVKLKALLGGESLGIVAHENHNLNYIKQCF